MHEPTDQFTLHNRINLPVCDIHEKEARSQLLANMHSFANATSTISERQMQKCQEQNERIRALGERINKCKNRIGHIGTLKSAVTFVTPSQYPKYEFDIQSNRNHLSEFYEHGKIYRYDPTSDFKTKHDVQNFGKESKISLKNINECASFILDELRMQPKGILQKRKTKENVENYGNIPSTVKYLDSLSVFNARVNPYRKYSIESNVLKIDRRSKLSKENLAPIMGDYLSSFDRVRNVEKTHRYVQPQQWIDHQFDLSLDLQNLVEFEGEETIEDYVEKKKENVVHEERKNEAESKIGESLEDVNEEKVPVLKIEKHATMLIEEKSEKKLNNQLFVPEIQPILLPNPPQLDLPIPPIHPTIPSFNLPPPPKLDLPPPLLSPPPNFDLPQPEPLSSPNQNASQIPAVSGNLLQEIKNARNKLNLKPTITKEPGVKNYESNEGPKQPDKGSGEGDMFAEMRAVLKKRKQRRYQALHPDQFADQ